MRKIKWLAFVVMVLVAVPTAFADDGAKLVGTWKLVSWEREVKATGEKEVLLGKNPSGYMIFTPEGRFMVILTGEGRQAPKTDKDRADLLKSMFALTGKYRVEGDKYFVKVDASWNPEWLGTDQERLFKIDANRLHIQTQWLVSPNWPEKGLCRGVFTLERAN
jgi:hypothetical protein